MSDAHSLTIEKDVTGAAAVLRLAGEIDLRNSPQLHSVLNDLLMGRFERVIFDLTGVGYMDSSGVGTIVNAKRLIEKKGGRLTLVGLQPRVRSVFEITRLESFFHIVSTLSEANKE